VLKMVAGVDDHCRKRENTQVPLKCSRDTFTTTTYSPRMGRAVAEGTHSLRKAGGDELKTSSSIPVWDERRR